MVLFSAPLTRAAGISMLLVLLSSIVGAAPAPENDLANVTNWPGSTPVYISTDPGLLEHYNNNPFGPGHTHPSTDVNFAHHDLSNTSFVLKDCEHKTCERTCDTDARVALWKWRLNCDKNRWQKIKNRCWGRAPRPNRCCKYMEDTEGRVPNWGKTPRSCSDYWPKGNWERLSCRHNCFWLLGGCTLNDDNPEWCKCMWRNCRA